MKRADVAPPPGRRGSLDVVGVGISSIAQTTLEAMACMRAADRLFYVVNDRVTELWLKELNPSSESLSHLYGPRKSRWRTYAEMARRMIQAVREGHRVCMVFYGHPGVFVQPSHAAIALLKGEGYAARMFPGISADSCLYCDLGINPGDTGIQSFEATDFLLAGRRFDATSGLILWQIGVLGESRARRGGHVREDRVRFLVKRLRRHYTAAHPVTLYKAAAFPEFVPTIVCVPLSQLAGQPISPLATLYVPPLAQRRLDARVVKWFGRRRLAARVDAAMRVRRPSRILKEAGQA